MKPFTTLVAFFAMGAILSCTDDAVQSTDDSTCLRAKFISNYCPADKPLHLIQFLSPTDLATAYKSQTSDTTYYLAAVLDLPESLQHADTEFYIESHYDQAAETKYRPTVCQAIFSPVKIIVCDVASKQSCENSLTKR